MFEWYLYGTEGQVGPYSADQIRDFLAAGSITLEHFAWRDGMAEWQPLSAISEFAPTAPPPAVQAPPVNQASAEIPPRPASRRPSPAFVVIVLLLLGAAGTLYGKPEIFDSLAAKVKGEHITEWNEESDARAAFSHYEAALRSSDLAAVRQRVSSSLAAELDGPDAADTLAMILTFRPAATFITAVSIMDTQATLTLVPQGDHSGMKGTAILHREEDGWKVFKENWRIEMGMSTTSADAAPAAEPTVIEDDSDYFDSTVPITGWATVTKNGDLPKYVGPPNDRFELTTGWMGGTKLSDPKKAEICFRFRSGKSFGNDRRIEMKLDATTTRPQPIIAEKENFRLIADGGQIYEIMGTGQIEVTEPYTGAPDGRFAGRVPTCTLGSAGFEFQIKVEWEVTGHWPK